MLKKEKLAKKNWLINCIMNLANKLTIFRMVLVPIFVIIGYIGIPGEIIGISNTIWCMNIIFIIASITDKLDGYLARKNNQVTDFGKFLDPIADKILVIAAMLILVGMQRLPAWIPIIVVFREFLVSGYRMMAAGKKGKVVAANKWGKLKTVTQMIALILIFIDNYAYFDFARGVIENPGFMTLNIIQSIIMTLSVIATIFSGYEYLKDGKDILLKYK
jgi:CDP-diacylglycerol--glycerol-3-phosphate 3-phosphatidyltransferase